jgi:hypothetical protein
MLFEENFRAKGIDVRNQKISSWSKLLKFILTSDFYKLLSEFSVETVPARKIRFIETYFADRLPNLDEVLKFSNSLYKLMCWLQGNLFILLDNFLRFG